jgi:hydroxypyruvate isomerase
VMVLEPLSDNPDQFLRTSDQTYMICRAVNSPACKILFDMYHMQKNEGHMIPHIDWAWSEIGYFQIGDNPGRKEPGTGEVNYRNIFKHVHGKLQAEPRDFIFGMEHGNAFPGKEGEQKLIDAYVAADAF